MWQPNKFLPVCCFSLVRLSGGYQLVDNEEGPRDVQYTASKLFANRLLMFKGFV